jgi:sigma-B regulation protein RsbU (phosphoserine phosphatase)
MAVLRRLGSLWGRTGWPERLLAVVLAIYLPLRWISPASTLRLLAGLALTLTGLAVGLRLARRGIRRAVWRLRNRLVVAYLFIAVVPIMLILALAGVGAYILTGQVTVYLVATMIERRTESLMGPAQELLSTSPQDRAGYIKWLVSYFRDRYPDLELLVRDGGNWQHPPAPPLAAPRPGHAVTNGLVLKDGRPYLWAHAVRGSAEAVILAPLTRRLLDSLIPDLGEVTFVGGQPPAPLLARGGGIPPAANRLDIAVRWVSLVPVALWDRPGETMDAPLGATSRPSAVLRALFGGRMGVQGVYAWLFLGMAGLFLLVELAALAIGVNMTRSITGAVHSLYQGTERIMQGDFSHRIEVRGNDQLAELGRSFNRMTENLERLLRVEKEKERLQSELEIAREVQNQLYPKTVPSVPGLELTAHCTPARTVSGDYYDYLGLMDSKLALAIGDVAGKGISAALLMATVQSSLRTQIRACLEAVAEGRRPGPALPAAELVSQLNQQLYAFTSAEKFSTFYFGIYDAASGSLTYTNAGHPPPILIRDGEALRLETNGMVVGAFPFAEYGESRIDLLPGDLLVCFTDGITEPENEYGEMFGEDRLIELLLKQSWRKPAEVIDTVYAAVRQWTWSPEAQDDMTMLVARRV